MIKIKILTLAFALVITTASGAFAQAKKEPLKIAYSDWPGWIAFEIGIQKGWFKEAGVDVKFEWMDYLPSMDAFAGGKVDAVTMTNGDALVTGANGGKSKFILLTDYSNGNDMIVAKPGIKSLKDLKGKKVGLEVTLVEHLLLLKGLEKMGMKQADVTLVPTPTNETPQTLASGQVDAIGAWYPVSQQALKAVPGSTPIWTSADAPGLIYDVLAVNPASLASRKDDWTKVAQVYYKIVDYLKDPKTKDDAVKIMAAKVKVAPEEFATFLPGTYFLTLAEAKARFKKGDGLDSIYGSTTTANKFNVDNAVYKDSQSADDYIDASIINALK
jgi:NitT/TauT family transport system substrate-binding protein